MYGSENPYSNGKDKRSSNGYSSYQNTGGYNPPNNSGNYAQKQTAVLEDTMRTHYETEATSAAVLAQMRTQRGQLEGAHDNVWQMRQAAEKAKNDLQVMIRKARQKKLRLKIIAGALGFIDFVLIIRLIQCGGSFFCRKSSYSSGNNYY